MSVVMSAQNAVQPVRRILLLPRQHQPWRRQAARLSLFAPTRAPASSPRHASLLPAAAVRLHGGNRTRGARAYSSTTSPYPEPSLQPPTPPPPQRSRFRRAVTFLFRGWFYSTVGFGLVLLVSGGIMLRDVVQHNKGDGGLLAAADGDGDGDGDEAAAVRAYLRQHPLVAELEADPRFRATHPHHKLPPMFRQHALTAGTLVGPGLMAVPPYVWQDERGEALVLIAHAGSGLCGHPGIVHGGFVATLLDEGLARCCFRALPAQLAMTAYLHIDYRAPTPAGAYLVLRATTTKVEGRKAWVRGRLETLPPPGSSEPPTLLAEAEGLFVSPKNAWALSLLAKAIS